MDEPETDFIGCTIKTLDRSLWQAAAATAREVNRANGAAVDQLSAATGEVLHPDHLAALTSKFWGTKGVKLTVSFMDNPSAALRSKLLLHFNAWATVAKANVKFTEVASGGQVRVARTPRDGYWSFLGVDILHIPANQQTMNLDSFTESTRESEFVRVVRHEVGHCLGFPHEHLRRELVTLLDRAKTIAYFRRTQGWNQQTVIEQVLTPLEESSIMGTPHADATSIMTYQISGECTISGQPIAGGIDIDATDAAFAASLYPVASPPPPPIGIAVPNVIGLQVDAATIAVSRVGLLPAVIGDLGGVVASQAPSGGTSVPAGSTVTMTMGVPIPGGDDNEFTLDGVKYRVVKVA